MAFVVIKLAAQIFANHNIMKLFKYLTINSLLNTDDILNNDVTVFFEFFAMLGIGFTLYFLGIVIFNKKDLLYILDLLST